MVVQTLKCFNCNGILFSISHGTEIWEGTITCSTCDYVNFVENGKVVDQNDKELDAISKQVNILDIWAEGKHFFSEPEWKLINLLYGDKLGNTLSECTVCPVGNSTCEEQMSISCLGIHPDKPPHVLRVLVCVLGVSDADKCPLNK